MCLIKMLHKKLISIVLPTYNGSRFLRDSIESVVSQTYEHWELIIVNDCSTDNTLKIAKEYEEREIHVLESFQIILIKNFQRA